MSASDACCRHVACAMFKQRQDSRWWFFLRGDSTRGGTWEAAMAQLGRELTGYYISLGYLTPPKSQESVDEIILDVIRTMEGEPLPAFRCPVAGFVLGEACCGWLSVSCLQSLQWDMETWVDHLQRLRLGDESLYNDLRCVAAEKRRGAQTSCRQALEF
ncbi:hypothetical protein ACCO45_012296 [Purpureocillium lilacinum]|uniref:Uncharacterized protein n=1 Tax=Purpureocillium lilacinum TaxID=33203 RepID=A0ACC4D8N9_PURLI